MRVNKVETKNPVNDGRHVLKELQAVASDPRVKRTPTDEA